MDLLILCCFGGIPFIEFPSSLVPTQPDGSRQIRHQWDPTDWIATDLSGSLLNASSNPALLSADPALKALIPVDLPAELSLEQCDLWNLTFASGADEHMFRRSRGQLKCRCPHEFAGSACHHQKQQQSIGHPSAESEENSSRQQDRAKSVVAKTTTAKPADSPGPPRPLPTAASSPSSNKTSSSNQSSDHHNNNDHDDLLPLLRPLQRRMLPSSSSSGAASYSSVSTPPSSMEQLATGLSRHENSFAMFLLVFIVLAAAIVALFMMLRGCCFCDCFGGFRGIGNNSARRYEQPLEPQTVARCMEAVRAHELDEKNKWAHHGQWTAVSPPPHSSLANPMVVDSRRPLLSQPTSGAVAVPSISESVPIPPPRACSPPPSYRSLNASLEQLPATQSTKI